MNHIVLALDPGTNCGWAVRYANGGMRSGVWLLHPDGGPGTRFVKLQNFLKETITNVQPEAIFYEQVRRHAGVQAAHIYGAITGIIQLEAEIAGIHYEGVPVSSIKAFATRSGAATKDGMMNAARQFWPGYVPIDDNDADARWIAEYGHSLMEI